MPGIHAVDALAARLLAQLLGDSLGYAVDASHSGHNPHLIANAYFAILANVALECTILFLDVKRLVYRIVCIFERASQIRLQIIFVHPFAGLQVATGMADGVAVLDDVLALLHIAEQHFMASRHVLGQYDALTSGFNHVAFLFLNEADNYRVCRINFQIGLLHND